MVIACRTNVRDNTEMQNMYKHEIELAYRVVKSAKCKAHIAVKSAPFMFCFWVILT